MPAARRKAAGFPTGKTFDVWDPAASSIPLPTQQPLRTLEWVQHRENLVVCGPAGTGKTFFLEALGQKVIGHTFPGRFVSATGQFLSATYGQFSCPPTGTFKCPLTLRRGLVFGGRSEPPVGG
jgi:hypothetical protein